MSDEVEHRLYVDIVKTVAIDYPYGEDIEEAYAMAECDPELYEFFPPAERPAIEYDYEVQHPDGYYRLRPEDPDYAPAPCPVDTDGDGNCASCARNMYFHGTVKKEMA